MVLWEFPKGDISKKIPASFAVTKDLGFIIPKIISISYLCKSQIFGHFLIT